jgi:hypothetical protein
VREAGGSVADEPRFGFLLFGSKYVVLIDQPELAEGVFTRVSGRYIVDLAHRFFRALWSEGVTPSLE